MTPQETTDKIKAAYEKWKVGEHRDRLEWGRLTLDLEPKDYVDLVTRLEQAERNEKTLREAVEHYADEETWVSAGTWDSHKSFYLPHANGFDIAAAALASVQDGGEG